MIESDGHGLTSQAVGVTTKTVDGATVISGALPACLHGTELPAGAGIQDNQADVGGAVDGGTFFESARVPVP
ncbi:MAG TPA: hypothetical protein VI248_05060 [Kineosporiaceae bacterium]